MTECLSLPIGIPGKEERGRESSAVTTLQVAWLTFTGIIATGILGTIATIAAKWIEVKQKSTNDNALIADGIRDDLIQQIGLLKTEVADLKREVERLNNNQASDREAHIRDAKQIEGLQRDLARERREKEAATKACETERTKHDAERAKWAKEKEEMQAEISILFNKSEIETALRREHQRQAADENALHQDAAEIGLDVDLGITMDAVTHLRDVVEYPSPDDDEELL
jgi:hypothetical protein